MGFGVYLMERSLRSYMSTQSIIFVMAPSALEASRRGVWGEHGLVLQTGVCTFSSHWPASKGRAACGNSEPGSKLRQMKSRTMEKYP